jgi:hypothetical protein
MIREILDENRISSKVRDYASCMLKSRRQVMTGTKICIIMLLISTCMMISACGGSVSYSNAETAEITEVQHGPPPHAPAHGYRYKHHNGEELVYRSDIGVYVVVGYTDYYYDRDMYYRLNNDSWETSLSIEGKWKHVSNKKLPKGLHNMKVCKKKK